MSADGLTYTLTMRDGVKFGDGTPLTAKSYADQLNRLLTVGPDCPNGVAGALATPYVKSIAAPDDKTIVFTLKTPVAYFPQLLASSTYMPADPKSFPADKCMLVRQRPFTALAPGSSRNVRPRVMVLEPNPYYKGALKPQVDQIIVRFC